MKVFLTNFDFEESLSRDSFEKAYYNKRSMAFESLYLWTGEENTTLYSELNYSDDFLSYIKSKRGFLIEAASNKPYTDLWLSSFCTKNNWDLEKVINSKETSHKCRKELELNLKSAKILRNSHDFEELRPPFILKEFFGFSGKGLFFARDHEQKKKIKNFQYPILSEPLLNRVRDFGVYYKNGYAEIVENLIDQRGQFRGALTKKSIPEEELILENTKPIFDWYSNKFGIDELQIDCFQYLEEGELRFNSLCEVNHRNTMGQVTSKLQREFGGACSVLIIVPNKKLQQFKSHKEREEQLSSLDYNSGLGVLILSSIDSDFQVFFITEVSDRALQILITQWWKKVRSGPEVALPREFIINS